MNMKKFLWRFCLTASVLFLTMTASAWAAEPAHWQETNTLKSWLAQNRKRLATYLVCLIMKKETLMVPLRPIAEALGYSVAWCAETGEVTVEDAYTQKSSAAAGNENDCF